jgi:hypothetical protein
MTRFEEKEKNPLRCTECNNGYFISDESLTCIRCDDLTNITFGEILKTKKTLIKTQQKIYNRCKKLGYDNSLKLICSYQEKIADEIITKQISLDKSLESFKKWIACSFILSSFHRINHYQKVNIVGEKTRQDNKKSIIKLINKLSIEYSDFHLMENDSIIFVRHNKNNIIQKLVPFDKPLYQTPSFVNIGINKTYHNQLDQIQSMYLRNTFKSSHLNVLASFFRMNFQTSYAANDKFQEIIEKLLTELSNLHSFISLTANSVLSIQRKELKGSKFKKLSDIFNQITKYGSQKTQDFEIDLLPVLQSSTSSTFFVGLRSLELINVILNPIKLNGETEQERGAWVENMNFRPLYGLNVKTELHGKKLFNVMNSDTKSRWKEIADFIVIGNKTNKVYVFEIKSRFVTTMKWMENELNKFHLKISAIKEELVRLDLPTDDVEFLFINTTTAVSNYKGIFVGSSNELTYRIVINEGFRDVKLHNEEDVIQFHEVEQIRGKHELYGRNFRLDIGMVLGVNAEDREISLIGMSPGNNKALIYIDVPEFIDLPKLSEHDKILFLAEDTMEGDVILSLHDWKLLSLIEWILWLSTPYLGDYENFNNNPSQSSSDDVKLVISLYQRKALESLSSNWKKIAKLFYFGYMGSINSVMKNYPFIIHYIHAIRSNIVDDLPVAIYTHRDDNSKTIIIVPYNGEMGVKGLCVKNIQSTRLEPEFNDFTQSLWFLITTHFLPNPTNDPEKFKQMLLLYVGREFFE